MMSRAWHSEWRPLAAFVVALLLVVVAASLAVRHPAAVRESLAVEDLPTCTQCADSSEPSPKSCMDAGGTVRFRPFRECVRQPSVRDVCDTGVPCFGERNDLACHDTKDPYCHCEASDQCPDGFSCQFDDRLSSDGKTLEPILGTGQCWKTDGDTSSKEPVMPFLTPSKLSL